MCSGVRGSTRTHFYVKSEIDGVLSRCVATHGYAVFVLVSEEVDCLHAVIVVAVCSAMEPVYDE